MLTQPPAEAAQPLEVPTPAQEPAVEVTPEVVPAAPAPELPQAEPMLPQAEVAPPAVDAMAAPVSETPAQAENSADGGNPVQDAAESAEHARLLQEIQQISGADLRKNPLEPGSESPETTSPSPQQTEAAAPPVPLVIHQTETGMEQETAVINSTQASSTPE